MAQFAMIAALLFAFVARAATPISEKELTEKLKLYTAISTLEVTFKQTKTLKDMNLKLKAEGRMNLKRPDRITWEITQPSPVLVALNQSEILIRTGKGADAQTQTLKLGDAPSDDGAKSLTGLIAWLQLDSKALYKRYEITQTADRSFHFAPKQKDSTPFEGLDMSLGANGQLSRLFIHELSGDALDIEFGKPKLTYR